MWLPSQRLRAHSCVALALLCGGVLAPVVLLLRRQFGLVVLALGLFLLMVGVASLIGAVTARALDRNACVPLQWRCMVAAAWLFNPIVIVIVSIWFKVTWAAWWSGLPLAVALAALSGRLRLVEGDPDWAREGCPLPPPLSLHWLFSRLVFIGLPLCLLSFQVALYLPKKEMLPKEFVIGLFICGGCVLISAKFCAMCACLARQRFTQGLVLLVLLSADWIGSLHLMQVINDDWKETLLLSHLLAAGLLQMCVALARLKLRPRWSRALLQRRTGAREGRGQDLDAELATHLRVRPVNTGESSDSDDDRGPGSLPDSFHEALAGVLGLPSGGSQTARRQFLCGARRAIVCGGRAPAVAADPFSIATAPPDSLKGPSGGLSSDGSKDDVSEHGTAMVSLGVSDSSMASSVTGVSPLEIGPESRTCTVCLEEIKTGEKVRPLPKCAHVFHAACLERWAKQMREETKCPMCRRPALARKPGEGSTSIAALGEDCESSAPQRPARRSTSSLTASDGSASSMAGRSRAGPARSATGRAVNASSIAAIRLSLGVSETLARAALECSGGAPDAAAHVLLEHRQLLVAVFNDRTASPGVLPPPGTVEAVVQANPDLVGMEDPLRRHLGSLYRTGRLRQNRWGEANCVHELFRALLVDVVRRLEERG